MTIEIQKGSRVGFHYTLSLAAGNVADTTQGGEPADIIVGDNDLLPIFENCLLGLCTGDQRRFEISCVDAFGPSEFDNVHPVARADFPPDIEPTPGLVVGFSLPNGQEIAGTLAEVTDLEVMVDFSHPLAGHDLVFEVEILSVQPPVPKTE